MKLIGSRMEDEIREELIKSNEWLFNSQKGDRIIQIAESLAGKVESAYLLWSTPGQGEDYYGLLINGKAVVGFELDRFNFFEAEPVELEVTDVRTYRRHLKGRPDNLRLLIAEELSQKDITKVGKTS